MSVEMNCETCAHEDKEGDEMPCRECLSGDDGVAIRYLRWVPPNCLWVIDEKGTKIFEVL